MKLASLRTQARDGALIVVSKDGTRYLPAQHVAPHLQAALDQWDACQAKLQALSDELQAGAGQPLELKQLGAPLPRAYEWLDGSAFLNHVELVRKARGAEMPESFLTDPLIYQGGSGVLLGPFDPIPLGDAAWGLDFEGELSVVLGDVPQGITAATAAPFVRLLMLVNDVSCRRLIPDELAKGFGFVTSKPASAFSPFAITPDELGDAWQDGRAHLDLTVRLNGERVGQVNAGPEMHFSFFELIAHISKTRSFTAGTIVGSGTVSNRDPAAGVSCLAERRMRETIELGQPLTEFLKPGDRIEIEMLDAQGNNLFGTIDQTVQSITAPAT